MVLGIELKNANRNNKHETDLTIWALFSLLLDLQDFIDFSAYNSYGESQNMSTKDLWNKSFWRFLLQKPLSARFVRYLRF